MNREQRTQALAALATIPDETRMLMMAVAQGRCAFCLCELDHPTPLLDAIRSGKHGAELKAMLDRGNAHLEEDGRDPETGHATDCRLLATMRAGGLVP